MKIIRYLLITILMIHSSSSLLARYNRSKSKQPYQVKDIQFNWWPRSCFQKNQNNISLTVKALSEKETSNLFLGNGKSFLTNKGWFFISQPIIPLHIIIKNENSFPVSFGKKSIDLGSYLLDKCSPLSIGNVMEVLNYDGVYSRATIIDPYLLNLNALNLSSLFTLDSSVLFDIDKLVQHAIIVEEGETKELLLFVWGKEIKADFNITIAKEQFKINLK